MKPVQRTSACDSINENDIYCAPGKHKEGLSPRKGVVIDKKGFIDLSFNLEAHNNHTVITNNSKTHNLMCGYLPNGKYKIKWFLCVRTEESVESELQYFSYDYDLLFKFVERDVDETSTKNLSDHCRTMGA